jgi:(1->4)-alpha-D-glucan 1-alpha-D-glucosylmutase
MTSSTTTASAKSLAAKRASNPFARACVSAGLGLVLDFVPNHAGVGPQNVYWQDLLAYGPYALHAGYFDVDWSPLKPELREKLLLPFLGRPYGQALDDGEISLVWQAERLSAAYFDHRFALRPESYAPVLAELLPELERTDTYWEVKEIYEAYASLEPEERDRAEALRERLAALANDIPLQTVVEHFAGERLHELLERQYWRLSYWKTAGYEINYRRFFDINELVAMRMEEPEVFFDAHRLLGNLLRREGVDGVRIDHIDGLYDPHGYLERLRELGARQIWVEKILAPGEILPADWPVEGTTGYEFLNDALRLLNYPEGEAALDRIYRRITRDDTSYTDTVVACKRLVIATKLSADLSRLGYELDRLSEADYRTRDFTLGALTETLTEVIAALQRYRTYLPYQADEAARVIKAAVQAGQRRNPAFEPLAYSFIREILLYAIPEDLSDKRAAWVGRFQQYTAPVAAKGVEDTAFYRYVRHVALNEVGGEPDRFADGPEVFHAHSRFRALKYPNTLLASATHDHKRGEDVRARLLVLAEMPDIWRRTVMSLERAASRHRGSRGPAASDQYLFYQSLVAIWGSSPTEELEQRLADYMQKAAREAKTNTSWLNPNAGYESDLTAFVRAMVRDRWVARAIDPLVKAISRFGFINSLSQLVLKATSPGVPDFYQGSELLDLSLVDPDNRRPVDFGQRLRLLDEVEPLLEQPDSDQLRRWLDEIDERAKLYLMARLLRLRINKPETFAGPYQSLEPEGAAADHFVSFIRGGEENPLVVTVPRFPATLAKSGALSDTHVVLPRRGQWYEVLSGRPFDTDGILPLDRLPLPWGILTEVPG